MVKNGDTLQNARKTVAPNQLPLEYSILRDRLSDLFKTKVQMTCSAQSKGRISISFANEDGGVYHECLRQTEEEVKQEHEE